MVDQSQVNRCFSHLNAVSESGARMGHKGLGGELKKSVAFPGSDEDGPLIGRPVPDYNQPLLSRESNG